MGVLQKSKAYQRQLRTRRTRQGSRSSQRRAPSRSGAQEIAGPQIVENLTACLLRCVARLPPLTVSGSRLSRGGGARPLVYSHLFVMRVSGV